MGYRSKDEVIKRAQVSWETEFREKMNLRRNKIRTESLSSQTQGGFTGLSLGCIIFGTEIKLESEATRIYILL